jgi:lipopolysaccharide transport system permease protein
MDVTTAGTGKASPTLMARALWNYKGFIGGMVARDFRSRYLNSVLGSIWAVIKPLVMIVIYTLIFSQVMRARLPGTADTLGYSLYLTAGILPWGFFAEVITRCQGIFLEQGNLIKKTAFPRTSLPLIAFLSALINFAIIFGIFLVFLAAVGRWPGLSLLGFLPLLVLQLGLAMGLGTFLGTINVFFRDVGHSLEVILQFWFWLTPIVYPAAAVPERLRFLLTINPLYAVFKGYQDIVLTHAWPDWSSLWPLAILTLVCLVLGYTGFRRLSGEMVDQL